MSERKIITDKLVLARTGRGLEDWFIELDHLGARKLSSRAIYDLTATIPGLQPLGEWNCGLLATAYGWSRGLREKGEKKDGFEISISKTCDVPAPVIFRWWHDRLRKGKTAEDLNISITKQTEGKSIRAACDDGTRLSIEFYEKGRHKGQVVLQHMKISGSAKAAEMKTFWKAEISRMEEDLASASA